MADGRGIFFKFIGIFLWWCCSQRVVFARRTLRMVNVVYRHGDRSPYTFFASVVHKDFWPQGPGQLTQIGMRQEYRLGRFLKSRYVDQLKLLNSSYLFKEIYVRSSDRDRCIMSAQTQLNGLYPPQGQQIWRKTLDWQPIGIHVMPANEDPLLRPYDYPCPRLIELQKQSVQTAKYKKMAEDYKDVIEYVSKHVGEEMNVGNIHQVFDTLFCEKSHNLTLPAWATNGTTWKALKNLSDFTMGWRFYSHDMQRLTGGNLVGAFVNNMKKYKQIPPSEENIVKKIYIYSAHDTTVTALLSALKMFDGITPAYSSAVMVELYSDDSNENGNLSVQVVYRFGQNNKLRILTLPNCTEYCALDEFVKQTADVVPENLDKECGTTEEHTCVTTLVYKSFLAAFIGVTTTLAFVLTCLCICCCQRKCRRRKGALVYNDLLKDARLLDKPDYDSDS